jgi:hypothetical protein
MGGPRRQEGRRGWGDEDRGHPNDEVIAKSEDSDALPPCTPPHRLSPAIRQDYEAAVQSVRSLLQVFYVPAPSLFTTGLYYAVLAGVCPGCRFRPKLRAWKIAAIAALLFLSPDAVGAC